MTGALGPPEARCAPNQLSDRCTDRSSRFPKLPPEIRSFRPISAPESFTPEPRRNASRVSRQQLERLDNRLSERDREVLTSLAQHRFLTTDQLSRFHFIAGGQVASTATRRCRRVLTRLSQLQVIESLGRRVGGFQAGSTAHVWCLGVIGDRLLRLGSNRPRARRKAPSLRHLEHCLAIGDTHLSLQNVPDHNLTELHTEPACWRSYRRPDHTTGSTLKPDLYAVTASGDYEDHWFIEVDRATESLPVLLGKCAQYRDYHRAGVEQAAARHLPARHLGGTERTAGGSTERRHPAGRPSSRTVPRQHPAAAAQHHPGRGSVSRLRNQLLVGDALQQLIQLPDSSIDMALTSPPYFRLRDYDTAGQLGLESHVGDWMQNLLRVSQQLRRLLLPTGTLWLNLGDSYSFHPSQGAPRKSLLLAPERLATALVADGWLLRNKIIWHKPNRMPTSVRDRLACSWEVLYVLARQPSYSFDLDSLRIPHTSRHRPSPTAAERTDNREAWRGPNADSASGLTRLKARGIAGHPLGKNPGDVWTIASSNYRGAHHATFPVELASRAIQAGSPEARCRSCHSPWRRQLVRSLGGTAVRGALGPSCDCDSQPEPAIVLDPFIGAGTTAVAAEALGRDWLGIELNPAFAGLAMRRIQDARAGPRQQTA